MYWGFGKKKKKEHWQQMLAQGQSLKKKKNRAVASNEYLTNTEFETSLCIEYEATLLFDSLNNK